VRGPVREVDPVVVADRRHVHRPGAERDPLVRDAGAHGREQVGAVRGVGLLAVQLLARGHEALGGQHGAVLPALELPGGGQRDGCAFEGLEPAEAAQEPDGVRRRHDPGAHLRQLRRLFEHTGLEPVRAQEAGGGQAADPTPDDGDAGGRSGCGLHGVLQWAGASLL
jgi:hypothetical protein